MVGLEAVMLRGAVFTSIDSCFVATACVGVNESVACTVKVKRPALVGVPVIVPFDARVSPLGNVPLEIAQLYGATPPLAVMRAGRYVDPYLPSGRVSLETNNGLTVCVAEPVTVGTSLTLAVTFSVKGPAAV